MQKTTDGRSRDALKKVQMFIVLIYFPKRPTRQMEPSAGNSLRPAYPIISKKGK